MAFNLPRFIAITTTSYPDKGHFYYNEGGSTVTLGEQSVFSTLVKIEVERATGNPNYVHLRFCHSNRYWSKSATRNVIIAESKQPVEDTKDPSCTLFQAVQADDEPAGVFYLNYVPTGGRLLVDNIETWGLFTEVNPPNTYGHLNYVDWSTLVKLPAHVAFKGDNGRFLKGMPWDGYNYLQFSSDDPNEEASGHRVSLMPDGHVRITSDYWDSKFWRRSPNWIWADSDQSSVDDKDTHFWPVIVDDNNTIALRNAGNNNYCGRLSTEGKTDMLNADVQNITKEARLVVQELVSQRNIYNVVYRMQDARIYDEVPYVAGSSVLTNSSDQEAAMAVQITYQDEKSYTFSRSFSLTAGVETSFSTGVPFIAEGGIKISFEINTTLQWDTTTTTTTSVMASGSVPVPARSSAVIDYVGTMGTCDIPYSYTQQDRSSADGTISYTEQDDGIYKGVSCYNFDFVTKSLNALV
ncbi:hypothetical protein SASPL_106965 [Salvia splendens]|uniref:Agglutinin domain-containing protein n=1 Tax=Salvia splendens TaxID=180675 RepID=A0A8X8YFL6_SALSN|nr:uncharacterized protein LOC121794237 [Salvia splendens]XP_042048251.1 uncharacterized protein LOC121794237 [Salvia splendens]XP_042048253.1 uncharacterized protein LOC121794237 [Salvia splendens]KAG6428926.1 hypothetical protein SASPL_106965 [Salvia splendens]